MDPVDKRLERIFDDIMWGDSVPVRERTRHRSDKWDSLAHLNLVLAIEQEFDIQLDDDDVMDMNSFDGAVLVVSEKLERI